MAPVNINAVHITCPCTACSWMTTAYLKLNVVMQLQYLLSKPPRPTVSAVSLK